MAEISIIMPVYNTGKILIQTINSVRQQTFEDWELIIVDDGSTDESAEICDRFSVEDHRIKVFHKENGGISNARNFALSKCQGKYIAFCDHDDEYTPNQLAMLYEAILTTDSDLSCCAARYVCDDGSSSVRFCVGDNAEIVKDVKPKYIEFYHKGLFESVWNKLYRKDFVLSNNIYFQESYKHGGEDIAFNNDIVSSKPTCVFIPEVLYIHYFRKNLSTSARFWPDSADMLYRLICSFNETIVRLDAMDAAYASYYNEVFYFYYQRYVSYLGYMNVGYTCFRTKCQIFKQSKISVEEPFYIPKLKFSKRIAYYMLVKDLYVLLYGLYSMKSFLRKIKNRR